MKLLASLLLFTVMGLGTTFVPVTIKSKIEDSDAIVYGTYIGSNSKKDKSGRVMTEATIQVEKNLGLNFNQLASQGMFKFRYPGGTWGGLVHKIEGVPEFKEGERTVVLLNEHDGAFVVRYLAAGKFSVVEEDDKEYLVSSVFEDKDGVGRISLAEFEDLLEESHFRQTFQEKQSEKHVVQKGLAPTGKGRKIASRKKKREPSSKRPSDKFNSTVLVIIFIILGLLFTHFRNRQH